MAVENGTQNVELAYLLDPAFQIEGLNGKPVIGGWLNVYEAGTDTKVITYQDFEGSRNPFNIKLGSDGRAVILADPSITYDVYAYDSYGNQIFSRLNVQCNVPGTINLSGADTRIKNTDGTLDISLRTMGNNVREYTVNTHNKILDCQSPLYFVENSETATVIGFSGDDYVSTSTYNTDITNITNNITALSSDVEGKMDVDKLEFENNKITGYDGSAFAGGGGSVDPSEFIPWSASGALQPSGNYYSASNPSGFINSDAISSMATTGFVADVSAEITALIPTAVTGDYLTKVSADTLYYPLESNPSGYLTAHQDLSQYAKTEDLTSYQEKGDYYSASNPSGFLTKTSADTLYQPIGDYATHDDLTAYQPAGDYADASALDGKVDVSSFTAFSSTTNEKIEYISGALSGTYELSAGYGIDITDYPNDQKTVISVTAQGGGGNPEVESLVTAQSATWNSVTGKADATALNDYATTAQLANKLDTTAFSTVSGNFLTAHQSLEGYATTQDVESAVSSKLDTTAFSTVSGDFLTAHQDLSDYQLTADMTAYQPVGDYLSATESANYYPMTGNPSGFLTEHQSLAGYLQDTDLTISDGKITEISGVPLSAGDELPEEVTAAASVVTANSATWNDVTAKQPAGDYYSASNPSGFIGSDDLISISGGSNIDISKIDNKVVISMTGDFATTGDLANKLDTTAFSTVSGNFLTAHQDLSNYATTAEVTAKLDTTAFSTVSGNFLTAHQDLSNYATTSQVADKLDTTAFSTVSGDFLTAVDLTPYQTTAGMTAYQPVGDYYSASNPSGFLTAVPAGTMNESNFGYDASNNITAYNGSAFKAGDEFPQSATDAIEYVTATSGDINSTIDNVSANSGVWGGSALPISAGQGIDLSLNDNTLVVSAVPSAFYTLSISNIVLTASLPGSPDANTLYLIQE